MKILIGIILGYIIHHHIRRLFLKWQLRELKRMAGIQSSEEGFYGTPGKCLQSAIDAETEVFGDSLILFHESPLLSQLKYYFYRLAHPDPVIYGDDIAE